MSKLNIVRKTQPISHIEVTRDGKFSMLKVSKTESGKIRVAATKDGVDAYLLSVADAKALVEAITTLTK